MNKYLLFFSITCLSMAQATAQKIEGQWKGYFNSKGDIVTKSDDNTEYVLELEIKGEDVTGFSYSYFQNRKYYVICSLKGTYYKSSKSMRVTETARVKGFTPPYWSDCLQTHILNYEKADGVEQLVGKWLPASGKLNECGSGSTTLIRRTLSKDLASFNQPKNNSPFSAPNKKEAPVVSKPKNTIKPSTPAPSTPKTLAVKPKLLTPDLEPKKPEVVVKETVKPAAPKMPISPEEAKLKGNLEKRGTEVIRIIDVDNNNFKVVLYDNGEVDGDSVSLFYNGRLLLSHQRLSTKPINLNLALDENLDTNELTMYAENLGTIPPNTALMIITDGEQRYEVRISSDLQKSGTIRFRKKDGFGGH